MIIENKFLIDLIKNDALLFGMLPYIAQSDEREGTAKTFSVYFSNLT